MMKTIETFINDELINKGKSPQTTRTYQNQLVQFETWLSEAGTDIRSYSRSDVQQYFDELTKQKKSASTMNTHFYAIKKFSTYIDKENCVQDIRLVKAAPIIQQAPAALTKLELQRIKREVDRTEKKRDIAIIFTLIYTGMRVSELVALDRDDISISERKGTILIRQGKGNAERKIPLHKEVRRAITEYLNTREDYNPVLFMSNYKKRISVRSVEYLCSKFGAHPHQFRHTFITDLVDAGIDDETIRTLTGHINVSMIARYRTVREEARENAIDNLFLD